MNRGEPCPRRSAPMLLVIAVGIAPTAAIAEFRSIDGSGNNIARPELGMAGMPLVRFTTPGYEDQVSEPGGAGRPSARWLSNALCAQSGSLPSAKGFTDFLWQWGQFLDHDIDLTGPAVPAEPFDIPVPPGDPFFDPHFTGTQVIPLERSLYDTASPEPRQQINEITAFIDGSNVYGSDPVRAAALRENDGTGRLKTSHFGADDPTTSHDDYLPRNTDGLPNAGGPDPNLFLAGDVRANEQVALTALHTLFVREHNRLAEEIAAADPSLTGDEIYERARAVVGAEMQVITYREFLPALLGTKALPPYAGYDPDVDPGIMNSFSTSAYRFGHSMLSSMLMRPDAGGDPISAGHLRLRQAFFAPHELDPAVTQGIAPLLRGLATHAAQEVDVKVVDDVRNFLFGLPGQGGFDLAALNMQRGRDHGLCDYNRARVDFGLDPVGSFDEITSDPDLAHMLRVVYGGLDEVDLWAGGLAEDHLPGASVGELLFTVLELQFRALRDGDRFWYENAFSEEEIEALEATKLSDIVRRNTEIGSEIPDYVFGDPCASWAQPLEVPGLVLERDPRDESTVISWTDPQGLAATPFFLSYGAIRSTDPADFLSDGLCLPLADGTDTTAVDAEVPEPSGVFYYLVHARNSCPVKGTLGLTSAGVERSGPGCP